MTPRSIREIKNLGIRYDKWIIKKVLAEVTQRLEGKKDGLLDEPLSEMIINCSPIKRP